MVNRGEGWEGKSVVLNSQERDLDGQPLSPCVELQTQTRTGALACPLRHVVREGGMRSLSPSGGNRRTAVEFPSPRIVTGECAKLALSLTRAYRLRRRGEEKRIAEVMSRSAGPIQEYASRQGACPAERPGE